MNAISRGTNIYGRNLSEFKEEHCFGTTVVERVGGTGP
jgi:hypothetical protein